MLSRLKSRQGQAMERQFPNGRNLRIVTGDITKIAVDAMVNAANSALAGGGGVDGAVHRAGGASIMADLAAYRSGCPTGSAVITGAGRLPARYVFHAVGPVYRGGDRGEAELLASCYETCLRLAVENSVRTISFPAISTGLYGYPMEPAARIAIRIVAGHLESAETSVKEAIFVLFDQIAYETYTRVLLE